MQELYAAYDNQDADIDLFGIADVL